jgi:hypothetical protein
MKRLLVGVLMFGLALAPAAARADVVVEAKAGTGVEKHQPVGVADSFAVGDKVWVWTHVTGGEGTKIKHVWKLDGKELWQTTLEIGGKDWTTNSRRQCTKAGSWVVEIQSEDGATKLGEVAFTVK